MNVDLQQEVERFRQWAVGREDSYGEWECDYEGWPSFWRAAESTIASSARHLDDIDADNLLYCLARDNEIEQVARTLEAHPEVFRLLAIRAVTYPDYAARWQIAASLPSVAGPHTRDLLLPYLDDPDEYVRRRALLACVEIDAALAEKISVANLNSEHEYTRLASLQILADLKSSHVAAAADKLKNDRSEHVRQIAEKFLKGI